VFTRWWSYLRSTLAALPGEASGVQRPQLTSDRPQASLTSL
uniref:Ghrelin and obestatin prepropeptide n=1 Tax=Saimiri boliviensis boliviensis TaxID=39432 RepID=A0A2K6S1E6_SAIBB